MGLRDGCAMVALGCAIENAHTFEGCAQLVARGESEGCAMVAPPSAQPFHYWSILT
jgi:hypothetical protein